MPEPAKVAGCFLARLADDRHIQAAADHAGDVSQRNPLFGERVIAVSRGTFLKHEPVEPRGIEPMHRGPAVEPLAHIGRYALFTRDPDQVRDEGVIAVAMDRWRKTDHRHAYATRRHRGCRLFGRDAWNRR